MADSSVTGDTSVGWTPGVGLTIGSGLSITGQGTGTLGTGAPIGGSKGSVFPSAVPARNVATPVITPSGGAGDTTLAAGFDLFVAMLNATLDAEKLRQSAVDQTVNIANLFAQLQKASPTQAADLAVTLGMPQMQPDLSFANKFATPASTGTFGGTVGTQSVKLPFAFSGKELSWLGGNPNVSSVLTDIGARFGRPDVMQSSLQSLIPGGSGIFKI